VTTDTHRPLDAIIEPNGRLPTRAKARDGQPISAPTPGTTHSQPFPRGSGSCTRQSGSAAGTVVDVGTVVTASGGAGTAVDAGTVVDVVDVVGVAGVLESDVPGVDVLVVAPAAAVAVVGATVPEPLAPDLGAPGTGARVPTGADAATDAATEELASDAVVGSVSRTAAASMSTAASCTADATSVSTAGVDGSSATYSTPTPTIGTTKNWLNRFHRSRCTAHLEARGTFCPHG
jgi:hypothetical protein